MNQGQILLDLLKALVQRLVVSKFKTIHSAKLWSMLKFSDGNSVTAAIAIPIFSYFQQKSQASKANIVKWYTCGCVLHTSYIVLRRQICPSSDSANIFNTKWNLKTNRYLKSLTFPQYKFYSILEAKASKGMHQVYIEKSPDRHLSIHLH